MKDKFFIDTNIVVYLFDNDNEKKCMTARSILKNALESENGVLSFQVIQEFCNAALKKFKKPLSTDDCRQFINRFLYPICDVFPGIELFNSALDIKGKSGYGFYDSLILAAAIKAGCNVLFTEDLQHGQEILGLKIVNPFVADQSKYPEIYFMDTP